MLVQGGILIVTVPLILWNFNRYMHGPSFCTSAICRGIVTQTCRMTEHSDQGESES